MFLIPPSISYMKKNLFRRFITMCMCWAYTYSIYVLSIQIARLIPADDMYLTFLILQTIFFVATLIHFLNGQCPNISFILQNLEDSAAATKYFNWNCFALSHRYGPEHRFFPRKRQYFESAAYLASFRYDCSFLCHAYRIISDSLRIYQLEQSRRIPLTGLANRACLFLMICRYCYKTKGAFPFYLWIWTALKGERSIRAYRRRSIPKAFLRPSVQKIFKDSGEDLPLWRG